MHLIGIAWKLLRYRVAVMLVLFMLIGAYFQASAAEHSWQLVAIALALAVSYISATSINDIVDEAIDRINHPASPGRPLVNGEVSRRQLYLLFAVASVLSISLAAVVSPAAAGLMTVSVVINVLYSMPPIKLSHRTFVVPLILALAYVGVPYALGIVAIGRSWLRLDTLMFIALYLLFVGRINLKDFRDRAGDAKYGKPTLLLKYGKAVTCLVSVVAIIGGDVFLLAALRDFGVLGWLLQPLIATILYLLWRLYRDDNSKTEQLYIGVGAKVGNGLLLTMLGAFLLKISAATAGTQLLFVASMLLVVLYNAWYLVKNPLQANSAYKG